MWYSTIRYAAVCLAILGGCLFASAVRADPPADFDTRLERAIVAAVAAHTGFAPGQIEIAVHEQRLPGPCREATAISVTIPSHDDAIGPTTVRARFDGPQGEIATLPIPVRVRVFADVLVTNRRLPRKEPIPPEALQSRRVEISGLARWVVSDPDSVVGMWAERTINADQIVDKRWLEPIPLVRRGDRITMTYSTGAVHVSTTGVAMEDGLRDETIRIKRTNGDRLLSAVVVDEKTVRPIAPY